MTLMSELQYWSPGRRIYYWLGEAYGLTGKYEAGRALLVYMGTEEQVKEALANGKRSIHPLKNKILNRERALAKKRKQRGNEQW